MTASRDVIRPQLAFRVTMGLVAGGWGVLVIVLVTHPDTAEAGWWISLAVSALVVAWGARSLLVRLEVHESGLMVVGLIGRRFYAWEAVDRFRFSKWLGRSMLVGSDGREHALTYFGLSAAERIRDAPSFGGDVSQSLNEWLAAARRG